MSEDEDEELQQRLAEAIKRGDEYIKRQMRERTTDRRERLLRRASEWVSIAEVADWLARQERVGGLDADPEACIYREFWKAVRDREFDHDGKTRVLLLNPGTPWTRLRPERGQWALETHGWEIFVQEFLASSWIEIERARHWLAGWLPRDLCRRWEASHAPTASNSDPIAMVEVQRAFRAPSAVPSHRSLDGPPAPGYQQNEREGEARDAAEVGQVDRIELLADWIFEHRLTEVGKVSTFSELLERAKIDRQLGRRKDFTQAFRLVYQTVRSRSPAAGWPFQEKYERRFLSEKAPKSPEE